MRYRKLGSTGIEVSEVGFGTWGVGGVTNDGPNSYGKTDDAVSLKALRRAHELGITFFDTSNLYGYGHAEELLGEAFSSVRDKVVITSKVGYLKHGGPWRLDPAYIREELEKTLTRLKTDYLDLYQLHSPPIKMLKENPEYVETLRELKKEGKIRAYGYSVKSPSEGFTVVNDFGFEVVEANFNLVDQRMIEIGLFDLLLEKDIGFIARTPFSFGFLTDTITDLNFPEDDHRSTWSKSQLKLWAQAPKLFEYLRDDKDWTAADLALMFCLSFPAVSTVIPGILTPEEAEKNARVGSLPLLSDEEIKKAIETYKAHSFFDKSETVE